MLFRSSLRDLWDNIKHTNKNLHYRRPRRRKETGPEKIFEGITAEKFPDMGKEMVPQVQEAQRALHRINPRRNTPRHKLIKLTKINNQEKILKTTREKQQITYKGILISLSADFLAETLQARRGIFKVMKEKTYSQEYSTQQGSHSDLIEQSKALQTSKS